MDHASLKPKGNDIGRLLLFNGCTICTHWSKKLILFRSVDSQALFFGVALETLRQDSRVFLRWHALPLVLCFDLCKPANINSYHRINFPVPRFSQPFTYYISSIAESSPSPILNPAPVLTLYTF